MNSQKTTFLSLLLISVISPTFSQSPPSHPRLIANQAEIETAKSWIRQYGWYRQLVEVHKQEVDRFIAKRPLYVSPVKQTYAYKMYTCPKHDVELLYEESRPFDHRCRRDTTESYTGGKYDASWAGWYNRVLASRLVWMGILYNVTGEERYADAGKEILMGFADLYLKYPTANTILGPAHVFFGTLSESFWGTDMAYGYDLLYNYRGFSAEDRKKLKEEFFYPLAKITQQFPESASNRQLWYNNVSAAVGFLYGDQDLIDFALKGQYGFSWQLGSAVPESGLWPEWSGYHFVALRGMIHLAEMARHNGLDLYHMAIAGRTMKKMFDVPFELILPNREFPRSKDSGGGNLLEYSTFYEVGYAVYGDPRYLSLLNETSMMRGTQVVGETSALGEANAPLTMFNLVPVLPRHTEDVYPEYSVNLEGNGFAVLRNGKDSSRRYLYLDYGIMGGEHGHPDRLQIGYFANGRNWIVDPLNESYFDPMLQLWFRQTIAHNTVVINQTSQTWTNGEGVFFRSLPSLQVASGKSETAYPGTRLTRTLIQSGDYFIDVFDVAAPESRIIDWPMHSFGSLSITGVHFTAEPKDLFGHEPGIPGYDQLTEIVSAKTDSGWAGVFTEDDQHLLLRAIGEPGTQLFQCISPRIGGFYKQMVRDPRPLPMVMSRRRTSLTRYVHLIQAFDKAPTVLGFAKGAQPNSYRIDRQDATDHLLINVPSSLYTLVRERGGRPLSASAFTAKEIRLGGRVLVTAETPLESFECRWIGDKLLVRLPDRYSRIRIWAPDAQRVESGGSALAVERNGEYVVLRSPRVSLQIEAPGDSTVFLGLSNQLSLKIWNGTGGKTRGRVSLALAGDWQERVKSQVEWWGGVVNLKTFHKGSVQRIVSPSQYRADAGWIQGVTSASLTIADGTSPSVGIPLPVPNDAAPAVYPLRIQFGKETLATSIKVMAPISARVYLPNGKKATLVVELRNNTPRALDATTTILPDKAWMTPSSLRRSVRLKPLEVGRIEVPIRLTSYNPKNLLYPVRVKIDCGGYHAELGRDLYVAIARVAARPPSLDGSWRGWNTSRPITVDQTEQICRLLLGNQPWGGPTDLSAKVYAMYDKEYLYVGAEVSDQTLVTTWNFPAMSYPWDTDCMEVVLDTRTGSDQGTDPPTPGLFRHLSMAEYRRTEFGPEKWRGGGAGGPLLPKPLLVPGAETYFARTDGGYTMICRYPFAQLTGLIPKPGMKIGFDVAFSDNDGTTYRKNQHIWAGFTQNQSWWDMGTIGAIIFE